MIDWRCIPILLTLERAVDKGTVDNLKVVIIKVAETYGGLTAFDIREKLITLRSNKISIFQPGYSAVQQLPRSLHDLI